MTDRPPLLKVRHLSRHFGGVHALDDVSLEIAPGEVHGLIGPNGAGKTTLVNVLTGFYRANSGEILLKGKLLQSHNTTRSARAGIARTFQNIRLFPELSAVDNVLVGRRDRVLARSFGRVFFLPAAERLVQRERVVAGDLLSRLGLESDEQRAAGTLSYGDQRRVEIARALATEPCLLLLDEPTAGMNRAETDRMGEVFRTLVTPERSLLLIEHDLPLIMAVCNRITVLNFGRVIATGTPAEIAVNPAVIEAYLGRDDDAAV